jgi:hypothetical protein
MKNTYINIHTHMKIIKIRDSITYLVKNKSILYYINIFKNKQKYFEIKVVFIFEGLVKIKIEINIKVTFSF